MSTVDDESREVSRKRELAVEDIYVEKTLLEHILLRPDKYIGSVHPVTELMWVIEDGKIVQKKIKYVPGLYKIFDEILVNAADNKQRDPTMDTIKIDVNPETNSISIWNNGKAIPVVEHKRKKMYVPTMMFGHLLTSSNFSDDAGKQLIGGRNGYGAKLCNIFSKRFEAETCSNDSKRGFKQVWENNMSKTKGPITKEFAGEDYTKVTFQPDLEKFKMTTLDGDMVSLFHRRAYDVAASVHGVKVYLNGIKLPIKGFKDYVDLFLEDVKDEMGNRINFAHEAVNDRWEIAVAPSRNEFQQISFVNTIATTKGGRHVDYIVDLVMTKLAETIRKKENGISIQPSHIRDHMVVFVNCLIEKPIFDTPVKETMTLEQNYFGSSCHPSEKFYADIIKSGLVHSELQWAKIIHNLLQIPGSGTPNRLPAGEPEKINDMPKLPDHADAGTSNSSRSSSMLTEGLSSAQTQLPKPSLGVIGHDSNYRILPLQNKQLNVRRTSRPTVTRVPESRHHPAGTIGSGANLVNIVPNPQVLYKEKYHVASATEAPSTDLAFQYAIKYLGTEDLLNCRLVNRKWNTLASVALRNKRLFVNNRRFLKGYQNGGDCTRTKMEIITTNANQLAATIENSTNIPLTGLHPRGFRMWEALGNLLTTNLFARIFGDCITRLSLSTDYPRPSQWVQLLQNLPNVEELEIFLDKSLMGTVEDYEPESIRLPQLKVLILHHNQDLEAGGSSLCEGVIRGAPLLKRIENFHCALTGAVVYAGKMSTVASLQFALTPADLPHLADFSEWAPQLTSMTLEGLIPTSSNISISKADRASFEQALFSILQSSRTTLTHLRSNSLRLVEFHPERMPALRKLSSVHIVRDDRLVDVRKCFSPLGKSGISQKFPALHKIRIELVYGVRSSSKLKFEIPPMESVQVLELTCQFDSGGMAVLTKMFPNVTHVRLDWSRCFPLYSDHNGMPAAWSLPPGVQKLDLHHFRFPQVENSGMGWSVGIATESFFTGISEDKCEELRAVTNVSEDPAKLRTKPAVVDLGELRELNVFMSYEKILGLQWKGSEGPLLSSVIGRYAFSLIPKLRVRFFYDYRHRCASDMAAILEPLTPFVTFHHCESSQSF